MLRLVFATAVLAACHPAPAPTVVRGAPSAPIATALPTPSVTPVRQDYELLEAMSPGPLHEVLATGHECKQERPGPIDDEPLPVPPVPGRRLLITVTPIASERHRDGQPVLH